MRTFRPTRAFACFCLLLGAFAALSGVAFGAGSGRADAGSAHRQAPAAGTQSQRGATIGPRTRRRRHRRHSRHLRRHHHPRYANGVVASPTPGSAAPQLDEAVPATKGANGGSGDGALPGKAANPPSTSTTTSPPPAESAPPVESPPPPESAPPVESVPPIATSHCFAAPHSCGYPDPTNTGVAPGVSLIPSGSITVSKPGTVVSGVDVTGTITITADNVTVENSRVTQTSTCGTTSTCGNYAIGIAPGLTGVKLVNVETRTTPGDTCQQDIRNTGSEVTIEGSYMHACDGNIYAVGPTVIENSYGVTKIEIATDHIENVYLNETSVEAIHDTLMNPVNQTAVIFGNSGGGINVTNCSNQITVLNSLLAGGGYSIYPCAHASQPGSSSINIQRNHFGRCLSAPTFEVAGGHHPCSGGFDSSGYYPNSGSYGIASSYFDGVGTWRGNVWDDDLSRVCIDGGSNCE
jgi:hypothetical protein